MNIINKTLSWYFTKNSLPYWCVLIVDCIIVFFSGILTYWVFHRTGGTLGHLVPLTRMLALVVLISCIGFKLFSTYSGIVRFSSFVDLQRVAMANTVSLVLTLAANKALSHVSDKILLHLNITQIVLLFIVATMLMWAVRVLVKQLHDIASVGKHAKRAFIYGVNEGGVGLAKVLRTEIPSRFVLKGFISHDGAESRHMLMGVRVYQANEHLADVLQEQRIEAVLISPLRNKEFRYNQKLQDIIINAGVKIYMSEPAKEWDNQNMSENTTKLEEVSVEDLLPRNEIEVDMSSIGQQLEGHRILITGSAGSIGSEIVKQVASFMPSLMVLVDQAETPQHDIRLLMSRQWPNIKCETIVTSIAKEKRMEAIFAKYKPEYVFHAAAYKHVPMMEDNPSESIQNNVFGTKILADLSVKYNVKKFVMISTDKAVNPTNVMGCSKRICEIYVQALDRSVKKGEQLSINGKPSQTQFVTTRFGNVLGSNGSVIPLFQKQIKKGGPVTVTHPDIIRYFMLIPEACKLVLEAGTKGKGGEIFVFDMGQPVKIADLAKRMIKLSGARNVEVQFTGLRAGEKLYEEMLNEEENVKTSFHKKIQIAKVREYDFNAVSGAIAELIQLSKNYDDMETVKKMKEIVPEYVSNNSVYSVLDN